MRTQHLVLGITAFSSIVYTATIPVAPPSHSKNNNIPPLPELIDSPISWSERLRVLGNRLLGRPGRHGQRGHAQHLGLDSSQMSQYAGDIVLRFSPTTQVEGSALLEASQVLLLDVWSSTREHVDIRLPERDVPSLLGLLPNSLQHAHTRLMPDLARAIQDTFPGVQKPFSDPLLEESRKDKVDDSNLFFQNYQPLSVIEPWMTLLESLFPSYVQVFSIGQSYEGREIKGLRVGIKAQDGERRKAVVVTGAAHAREWISVSTVSYLAYAFITNNLKDKKITSLVNEFDWIFIPTLNVDGYVYTWEHDRLWRKNRQPTSLSFCPGIDLDRSYDVQWEALKAQSNPCSDSFPGEAPFEAVEAKKLSDWMAKMKTEGLDFVGYIDFHSYSQQILYPYSYSCSTLPPDLENLEELAMGLAKVIRIHSGEHYEVSSACGGAGYFTQSLTGGGGSALDYVYSNHVPYAYQIKLRDTGSYGFLLPRENILPTGAESLGLLKYFGEFLREGIVGNEVDDEYLLETELRK